MESEDADRLGPLVASGGGGGGIGSASGRGGRRHDDDDDDVVRPPLSDRDMDHGTDGTVGFEYSPPLAMSPQMQYTVAARALARATPMPTERLGRTSFGTQQSFYGMSGTGAGTGGGGNGSGASIASGSGGGGTSIVVTSDDRRGGSQIFVVSGGGSGGGGSALNSASITGPRGSFSTGPTGPASDRRGSGISLTSQQPRPLPVSRQASGLILAPAATVGAVPYVGFRPPMDSIASAGGETVDSDA